MVELEHTLIMLLLLIHLLRIRPGTHPTLRWLIVGVVLLAFIAPSPPLALPWGLFSALFIPILLWQSAQGLGNTGWFGGSRDVVLWFVLALGITGVIFLTGALSITSALLFGLLAASFVWNTMHPEKKETLLGQIGLLTLVFLLTGMEAVIEAPGRFVLALFAGGAVGAAIGYFSVLAAGRYTAGFQRDLFSIAQAYLAYGVGVLAGISAVAAAVLSIAVYVAYGTKRGLWADGQITPRPFEHRAIYAVGVAVLAFFGWQTHVPFTFNVIVEVVLALLLTAVVFWAGRRAQSAESGIQTNLPDTLFQVGFLLAAALLLWPKSMLIDPLPLLIALGFASITALSASVLLAPMVQLFSWLEEAQAETTSETTVPSWQVKDLMRQDFLALPPSTPVEKISSALSAHETGSALIINETGDLKGIVTEADLFVKEEKLPRTDVTYLALFQHPVQPEYIQQTYNSVRGKYCASDIMSTPVLTIGSDEPVGRAIHLFVKQGYKLIPVMDKQGDGEYVVGVITRADLIRYFLTPSEQAKEELPPESSQE